MFVTILLGDSRMEMFNLNCKLINFIHHLKERCSLDFKECVDLMDSSGQVMNLEMKQQSAALASSVLLERQYYILLRVCPLDLLLSGEGNGVPGDDDTVGQKYVSLLDNYSQIPTELTERLRKLSDPHKERDTKITRRTQRSRTKNKKHQLQ